MLTMLLEKVDGVDRRMNDMQDDINAVQGEFTTLHEDVALLRDQMEHNPSIPPSHQAGVGSRSNRSHGEESEAAYSHHRSHYGYVNKEEWRDERGDISIIMVGGEKAVDPIGSMETIEEIIEMGTEGKETGMMTIKEL